MAVFPDCTLAFMKTAYTMYKLMRQRYCIKDKLEKNLLFFIP